MAALRDNTAATSRARRIQRHRRMRVRVRRVVLPRPEVKPSRRRWVASRLLVAFLLAMLLHGGLWLLVPKHRPAPMKSKGVIEVQMREKGERRKHDQSPLVSKTPQRPTPTRPQPRPAPQDTKPEQKAYEPSPSDQSSQSTPPVASGGATQEPSASGGAASPSGNNTDPSKVRLFDPSALGKTVSRWSGELPSADQFMKPDSVGDGNSPEAEKSRVTSRLQGQFAQAEAEGRVAGGLVSSCNDGFDQGQDGLMDCADPGCRLLPACQNTKEFKNLEAQDIRDADVRGTVSSVTVNDGDDEKIRSLSVQLNLVHSSPGDLEVELEHNGHKQVLRLADRSNHFFEKAFLAADFIGGDATGVWTVRIRDVIRGTSGTLRGWTLFVTR